MENLVYRANELGSSLDARATYIRSLLWRQMTTLLLELKGRYIPLRGKLVK
jgi:hypothetical protein